MSEADFAPSVLTNDKPYYKINDFGNEKLNNHFEKDPVSDTYQNSLKKLDNLGSSQNDSSLILPKVQNNDSQYISVNDIHSHNSHSEQNGNVEYPDRLQNPSFSKNEINQHYTKPRPTLNLPSPDAKFPIQARDEFTPVYENQPFPPDLAPAVHGKSPFNNDSLNVIHENILKPEETRDSLDSDRLSSEVSQAGSDSSETLPKMLAHNVQYDSQESSLNSNMDEKPQIAAVMDTSSVNKSISPSEQVTGLGTPSSIVPQSPQYVLTAGDCSETQDEDSHYVEEEVTSDNQRCTCKQ